MTLHTRPLPISKPKISKPTAVLSSLSLGLFASSLMLLAPASASVLVKPAILREETAAPTVDERPQASPSQNIVGIASETLGFSTLVTAIEAANIGSVLSMEGPLTVFAPTDAAFAALPAGALDALLSPGNSDLLVKLLYNHVAYGDLTSDKLAVGAVDTFDSAVNVAFTPTGVVVDGANVVQADIDASNGVIHAVDQVLLPVGFSRQLQARIDGVDSTAEAARRTPSISRRPASTEAAPTAASVDASGGEPSTSATEDAPVRALW